MTRLSARAFAGCEMYHSSEVIGAGAINIILYLFWIRRLIVFSQGGAGHAFRKTTAGAFGPDLAKKLSQLVKMEKNVMRSMELVGRERMEVAVSCIQSN